MTRSIRILHAPSPLGLKPQLEGRVSFRRAMKQAITAAMRMGAEGVRIKVAGRFGTEAIDYGVAALYTHDGGWRDDTASKGSCL